MSSPNPSTNLLPALPDRRDFDYAPPIAPPNILHLDEDLIIVDKPVSYTHLTLPTKA